jgi:hypothetical protein
LMIHLLIHLIDDMWASGCYMVLPRGKILKCVEKVCKE